MRLKNGKISILFSEDGLDIEIYDNDSVIQFCEIHLDQEQTCQSLSRYAHVPCVIDIRGLEKIGKKRLSKNITFPMPECEWKDRTKVATEEGAKHTPKGWEGPTYFGSQGSFYREVNVEYARGTIHKWVDNAEEAQ